MQRSHDLFHHFTGSQDKPNAIITGSGTWSIKLNNGSEDALENFKVFRNDQRSICPPHDSLMEQFDNHSLRRRSG